MFFPKHLSYLKYLGDLSPNFAINQVPVDWAKEIFKDD